ncbi:MAG: class I SAM-dependent methyltransferase [Planctomycetaceae bacterium]|nr:class I SAM-dependent methyltransferase [Planctomycetaceae bacterium]
MKHQATNASAAAHNRNAWDQLAKHKQRFTRAAKDEEFRNPLQILDGNGWLGGQIEGKQLLCLAAGGGRQAPLYATTGARVTVVDVSPDQLELDRIVAAERGLDIRTIETSMDDLTMFSVGEFDIVIHPVSTCYVPNVNAVYQQVSRVTAAGGLYISQHKQPVSLQASTTPINQGYPLAEPYYREGPLPAVTGSLHREEGTLEFLHRWDQLLGAMCRAGFFIEDLTEPCHAEPEAELGTFGHRSQYAPPYVRIKARRRADNQQMPMVWTP